MKKVFLTVIVLLLCTLSKAAYQNGDQVQNFSWLESDGITSVPTNNTVEGVVNDNKVLLLSWGYNGCQYCAQEAPILQQIFSDPKYKDKVHFAWGSTNDASWTSINGTGWRKKFTPNLTYMLSISTSLGAKATDFGVTGVPHISLIGADRRLFATHTGFSPTTTEANLKKDLDDMIAVYGGQKIYTLPVSPLTLNYNASSSIDLKKFFISKNPVSYSIVSNSNASGLNSTIEGTILKLAANNSGPDDLVLVTVKAEAGSINASITFKINLNDPNAIWAQWGANYDPSAAIGANSPLKMAMDFDIGTNKLVVKKLVFGLTKAENNVKWKIVTTDSNGKPTDNIIGSLSGTFSSIDSDPDIVPIINETQISGHIALVMESAGNFMSRDPGAVSAHTWVAVGTGAWNLLTSMNQSMTGSWNMRIKLASFNSISTSDLLPGSVSMQQNYPNPFNPATSISYYSNMDGDVKLAVYNAAGAEVAVLSHGFQKSGLHNFTFNGSNMQSGVYFYKLTTPTGSLTRKMLLVK